jgi:hypothetical protein
MRGPKVPRPMRRGQHVEEFSSSELRALSKLAGTGASGRGQSAIVADANPPTPNRKSYISQSHAPIGARCLERSLNRQFAIKRHFSGTVRVLDTECVGQPEWEKRRNAQSLAFDSLGSASHHAHHRRWTCTTRGIGLFREVSIGAVGATREPVGRAQRAQNENGGRAASRRHGLM